MFKQLYRRLLYAPRSWRRKAFRALSLGHKCCWPPVSWLRDTSTWLLRMCTKHLDMPSMTTLDSSGYARLLHVLMKTLRARWIGLIRIRRTPLFSDDAFDWAQLNPDESSERFQLIRKKIRMSSDELDTRPHPREDVKVLYDSLIRISIERSRNSSHLISSHLMSVVDG